MTIRVNWLTTFGRSQVHLRPQLWAVQRESARPAPHRQFQGDPMSACAVIWSRIPRRQTGPLAARAPRGRNAPPDGLPVPAVREQHGAGDT